MIKGSILLLTVTLLGLGLSLLYWRPNAVPNLELPIVYVGTWRCPPEPGGTLDGEWGPTQVTMSLRKNRDFKAVLEVIDSPGGSGLTTQEGRFSVDGERFSSKDFDAGNPCTMSIDDDHLVVTLSGGEVYRFARVR
jgi:hypothetical protein